MFKIGQLECVSYAAVCGMSYFVDNEKPLISKDDYQERELYVKLHTLIVETRPGGFGNVFFSLMYAHHSHYFMHFMSLFIKQLI